MLSFARSCLTVARQSPVFPLALEAIDSIENRCPIFSWPLPPRVLNGTMTRCIYPPIMPLTPPIQKKLNFKQAALVGWSFCGIVFYEVLHRQWTGVHLSLLPQSLHLDSSQGTKIECPADFPTTHGWAFVGEAANDLQIAVRILLHHLLQDMGFACSSSLIHQPLLVREVLSTQLHRPEIASGS